MIYFSFFLAGSLLGFFISLILFKYTKPFRDLQKKLDAKEAEYARYQDHVAEHFDKTVALFSELQVRQDRLVNHLQEGARSLRGGMLDTHDVIAIGGYKENGPRDYPLTTEHGA